MNEFPCWRFHDDGARRIFQTAEDLAAAGDGWHDSPAKISPEAKATEAVEEASETPEAVSGASAPAEGEAEPASLEDLDKADLWKLADEYGVEYDKRWGRTKLIDHIKLKLEQGTGAAAE